VSKSLSPAHAIDPKISCAIDDINQTMLYFHKPGNRESYEAAEEWIKQV